MTLRTGGAVPGIAVSGTIAMGGTAGAWAGAAPVPAVPVPGFRAAFFAGMVICIAVAVAPVSVEGGTAPAVTGPGRDCKP